EIGGDALPTVEVYDPISNVFEAVADLLSSPRKNHAAALLPNGRVLIAGGSDSSSTLDTADVYDPSADAVSYAGRMSGPREGLSATTLSDGRVFLAGGRDQKGDLASAEFYDVTDGKFSASVKLKTARHSHLAFLLPDNNSVVMAGGVVGARASAAAE